MIDRETLFRNILVASGSDLYTAVSTRVWFPVARKNFTNTEKAIVFHNEVSDHHTTGATARSTFTCKCYGGSGSYSDAKNVAGNLIDKIHDYKDSNVHKAEVIQDFQGATEPQADGANWPSYVVKVRVTFNRDPS